MAGTRWLRLLIAALLSLTFVACGGDDDDPLDDANVDTNDDGDDSGDDPGDDSGDDSGDTGDLDDAAAFLDALGGDGCTGLYTLYASMFASLGSPTGEPSDSDEYLDALAESAPDEIADDFATLSEAMGAYFAALQDAGVDLSGGGADPSDPEAMAAYLAALEEAQAEIDPEALEEASTNIAAWAEEECPAYTGG